MGLAWVCQHARTMISLIAVLALCRFQSQVEMRPVSTAEVQGEFYAPADAKGKLPAILVVHGSEGGIQFTRATAKALAADG